jgi:hypothetical protein
LIILNIFSRRKIMKKFLSAILCMGISLAAGLLFTTTGMAFEKVDGAGTSGTNGCLSCHPFNLIHYNGMDTAHKTLMCDQCHTGTPGTGTVYSSKCIVCHPVEDPGFCPLVNRHHGRCDSCHGGPPDNCAPPVTTTTTAPGGCPAARFLQSQDDINALRMARNVLLKTPYGTTLTSLYYKNAFEIVSLLQKNPGLQQELRDIIDENRITIWQFITTEKIKLSGDTENRVIGFLKALKEGSSVRLNRDIDRVIQDIKSGYLLKVIEQPDKK